MSNNRFNTYEDLEDFRRTRWSLNRQIDNLYNEIKTLPDVSDIEFIDFTDNCLEKIALLEKKLQHMAILSDFEAMSYACRLREICITLKCELNRNAFANVETVKNLINKVYYKQKPQKLESVNSILTYLKLVGCGYSLKPYEEFLTEVKTPKRHPLKVKDI
jgi:hypothetical protein